MSTPTPLPHAVLASRRPALLSTLKEFGVIKAGVFGSAARGTDKAESDIDLIVEFRPGANRDLILLSDALSTVAGLPVDVVDADDVFERAMSTGVGTSILRDTVPL